MKNFRKYLPFIALGIILLALIIFFIVKAAASTNSSLISASGTIEGTSVQISPEIGGKVASVAVQEGQQVKPGDVLFAMDDTLLGAQKKVAEAALLLSQDAAATAQAAYNTALTNYNTILDSSRSAQDANPAANWRGINPGSYNLPGASFSQADLLSAAQTEVNQAQTALNDANDALSKVLANPANQDFLKAEADLLAKRAAYLSAQAAVNQANLSNNTDLKSAAQTTFDTASTDLQTSQSNYDSLKESDPAKAVIAARLAVTLAQTRYNAAADQLALLQTGEFSPRVLAAKDALDQAQAALTQADQAVVQAQANLDLVAVQVGKLTVSAPSQGTIATLSIQPGEVLSAGAAAISLVNLQDLTITIYVPENVYGQIALGQSATLTVDSYPGENFSAKVVNIADQAEFTPRNVQTVAGRKTTVFAIKLQIDNPSTKLKPGMPADVVLDVKATAK